MSKELIVLKKLKDGSLESNIDYTDDVVGNMGLLLYFISKNLDMSNEELFSELKKSLASWQNFRNNYPNCFDECSENDK